ncbi:hypothetical protein OS190_06920 [Sulfitobacter sp. F26204]|uniref:hypothetical protein n=1 Tax=Sulfitobacter sp. F26204 TaxID=2996014 RepID=UPI00225E00AD|nr:hypothetical protein [Sulfitobacter sp. F26204]MCX7559297.1 hypothetical protein [Sulfitobacter sp. F26204]
MKITGHPFSTSAQVRDGIPLSVGPVPVPQFVDNDDSAVFACSGAAPSLQDVHSVLMGAGRAQTQTGSDQVAVMAFDHWQDRRRNLFVPKDVQHIRRFPFACRSCDDV